MSALLTNTGTLGLPAQYFNLATEETVANLFHTITGQRTLKQTATSVGLPSPKAYFKYILQHCSTPNGTFSAKGDFYQFALLMRYGLFVNKSFRYVYLTREDLMMQAISLYKAHAIGAWSNLHPTHGALQFNADAILANVEYLTRMMSHWEQAFSLFGIRPLRITYEQLECDPAAIILRIAEHVNVILNGDQLSMAAPISRQRNNESEDWAQPVVNLVSQYCCQSN